jgi:hypothetical protein
MDTATFTGNEVTSSTVFLFFQNANEKGSPGLDVS